MINGLTIAQVTFTLRALHVRESLSPGQPEGSDKDSQGMDAADCDTLTTANVEVLWN